LPWAVAIFNLILSAPYLYDPTIRVGGDYIAYIQQISAVYFGERDYSLLSSVLGPAYYPAGNFWQYMPIFQLHMLTDQAEFWSRLCHQGFHTAILFFVIKISYLYFYYSPEKAQLIAFILLANKNDRIFHSEMYNDEVMMMWLVIAIYLVLQNRPMLASLVFTWALSIKAGVLLLMPAFLGQMQYNFGTVNLIKSIIIILAVQVIVALPFLLGETSIAIYLEKSKLTG